MRRSSIKKTMRTLTVGTGAAILFLLGQMTVYAAENGPLNVEISILSNGDFQVSIEEPMEYLPYSYKIVGYDLSFCGQDGKKEHTFRLAFDESATETEYNGNHTRLVTKKVIPSEDIRSQMEKASERIQNAYEERRGGFLLDPVIAVSNDGGKTYSGNLKRRENGMTPETIPNEAYPDASYILSMDTDQDMVFGRDEEYRLSSLYEWTDKNTLLSLYNIPLPSREYEEESLTDSSYQDKDEEHAAVSERVRTFRSWEADSILPREDGDPYIKAYHDSRAYTDHEGNHAAFTGNGQEGITIPSGEKLIAGITADSLYGTAEIGLRGTANTWDFTYHYTYNVICYGNDGMPFVDEREDSLEIPVTRRAYYYYVWGLDLYDLDHAVAENDVYGATAPFKAGDLHLASQEIQAEYEKRPVTTEELHSYLLEAYGEAETTNERPDYEIQFHSYEDGKVQAQKSENRTIKSYVPDDDAHVDWADIDTDRDLGNIGIAGSVISGTSEGDTAQTAGEWARTRAWADANRIVGNGADIKTETIHGEEDSFAEVTNDFLVFGYDQVPVLSGDTCKVRFGHDDEGYLEEYGKGEIPPYLEDVVNQFPDVPFDTYETTPAFGREQMAISKETQNGAYFTGVSAVYQPVLTHLENSEPYEIKIEKAVVEESMYPAVREGYTPNEPVNVLTPVISPVVITKGDGQEGSFDQDTQLTEEYLDGISPLGLINLKLDETYTLQFDDGKHLELQGYLDSSSLDNAWEETENKYDKYTKAKYLHFPFDVVLVHPDGTREAIRHSEKEPSVAGDPLTDGSEFLKKDPDGGQYWIMLDESEWESVTFYIPPWAVEGTYNSNLHGQRIKCRVDAQNVVTEEEDNRDGDEGEGMNGEPELYTAVYGIDSEVSGWVYDFEILAVDDGAAYGNGTGTETWHVFEEPKKTGSRNRLGEAAVRRQDGTVDESWKKEDTLTLGDGKSGQYPDMGALATGTSFSFSVRTMSNLWHSKDHIRIRPSFRYISENGEVYDPDEFTLLADSSKGILLPYPQWENQQTLSLSAPCFGSADIFNDIIWKAKGPKVEALAVSGSDRVVFQNSHSDEALVRDALKLYHNKPLIKMFPEIILGDSLKVYDGSVELLEGNLETDRGEEMDSSILPIPYEDADPDTADSPSMEEERADNLLKISMQRWFGTFSIPDKLYISLKSEDEIRQRAETGGGLTGKETDLFEQGGYLILNFDLTTVKETGGGETEHLSFKGHGGLDMWSVQGQDTQIRVKGKTITTRSGDVAVIDLSRHKNDSYQANFIQVN